VNRLVPAAGDFDVGDKVAPLKHEGLSAGILICFEVIFPELARAHARKGANLLVNLTNDAWFGMTSAPYQHLSMAVFRSVENRLPTIRAANTGFSAFISPRGEILKKSDLFTEAVLNAPVDISESTLPFYARYGDLFALSLLVISLIKIFYCLWRRRGEQG
ncbi:MAG: apolipoprotein N-acyltransferase, partial [Deltaproteobacteria bacterium]|nr:apolipoprotein N-acyltransferase [Deltaproteobacteria bacterium]